MSVKNVPAIVNIKSPKGRFIEHKSSTGWAVGVVKSVERKKSVYRVLLVSLQSSISTREVSRSLQDEYLCHPVRHTDGRCAFT